MHFIHIFCAYLYLISDGSVLISLNLLYSPKPSAGEGLGLVSPGYLKRTACALIIRSAIPDFQV